MASAPSRLAACLSARCSWSRKLQRGLVTLPPAAPTRHRLRSGFGGTAVSQRRCRKYLSRQRVTGRDGRDWIGRDGTRLDGTGRDGPGKDGAGRDGTGRDGTGRDGVGPPPQRPFSASLPRVPPRTFFHIALELKCARLFHDSTQASPRLALPSRALAARGLPQSTPSTRGRANSSTRNCMPPVLYGHVRGCVRTLYLLL